MKAITPSFKDEKTGATLDDESKIKWQVALSAGERNVSCRSVLLSSVPAGQLLSAVFDCYGSGS